VADSRYATHLQLLEFADLDGFEFRRRVFNWRAQRLVRHGLLRKQIVPYLNGEALYSISRPGIEALERMGTYYLGANVERERDPSEFQIPHALELNNIRLTLLRTGTLFSWIPESFIRVLNLSPAHAYAKVYDGIAKVFFDGEFAEFAVEYERTLKSLPKYKKIREAIESETRLNAFLYLVPSWHLLIPPCCARPGSDPILDRPLPPPAATGSSREVFCRSATTKRRIASNKAGRG